MQEHGEDQEDEEEQEDEEDEEDEEDQEDQEDQEDEEDGTRLRICTRAQLSGTCKLTELSSCGEPQF